MKCIKISLSFFTIIFQSFFVKAEQPRDFEENLSSIQNQVEFFQKLNENRLEIISAFEFTQKNPNLEEEFYPRLKFDIFLFINLLSRSQVSYKKLSEISILPYEEREIKEHLSKLRKFKQRSHSSVIRSRRAITGQRPLLYYTRPSVHFFKYKDILPGFYSKEQTLDVNNQEQRERSFGISSEQYHSIIISVYKCSLNFCESLDKLSASSIYDLASSKRASLESLLIDFFSLDKTMQILKDSDAMTKEAFYEKYRETFPLSCRAKDATSQESVISSIYQVILPVLSNCHKCTLTAMEQGLVKFKK